MDDKAFGFAHIHAFRGIICGSRVSCSQREIILVGRSIASIAYRISQAVPLLVPSKCGPVPSPGRMSMLSEGSLS
jgi:hypothetical protein